MAIFQQVPACGYNVDYVLQYQSNAAETPAFAWKEEDELTPHESGTVYFQVEETSYTDSTGATLDYAEGAASVMLVGTTNDDLQPNDEVVTNEVEYPVKIWDCRLYLSLSNTLTTSIKLGTSLSISLGLDRPTNTGVCGDNTLIANLQDDSALPSFFTFTDSNGNLSAITEENQDIGHYDIVFTSTNDYHTNPVLTQTLETTVTIAPCIITSFEASNTPELIEIVLKYPTERFFPLPTFVQTPDCNYSETWSFEIVWGLSEDTTFATLYDDLDSLQMGYLATAGQSNQTTTVIIHSELDNQIVRYGTDGEADTYFDPGIGQDFNQPVNLVDCTLYLTFNPTSLSTTVLGEPQSSYIDL